MLNTLRFMSVYLVTFCFLSILSWLFGSFILSPDSFNLDAETIQWIILAICLIFGGLAAVPITWFWYRMAEADEDTDFKVHKRTTLIRHRIPR